MVEKHKSKEMGRSAMHTMKNAIKICLVMIAFALVTACAVSDPEDAGDAIHEDDLHNATTEADIGADAEADAGQAVWYGELTLETVLLMANQRRQIVHEPDMERIYRWIETREPVTFDGAGLFNSRRKDNLSKEEAAHDVTVLFELLRHMYAGYHHFGGDEVFLPMQNEMLEEIALRERWTDIRLVQMIQEHLGAVVADNHFMINSYNSSSFGNPHNTFVWNTPFDRSESGFSNRETGLYVSDVNGHDLNELFRLAMNEHGEFYYAPVILKPAAEGTSYSLDITYEDGSQQTVNLTRTVYERAHARNANHSLRYQNDIPIVSIRRMGDPFNHYANNHRQALQVLGYAEQLQDAPVLIVDLRSSDGGASALPYAWVHRVLGEVVPSGFGWLGFFDSEIDIPPGVRRPERWYSGFSNRAGFDFEYPPELFGLYIHLTDLEENIKFTAEEALDRVVSNDRLMIVLVDRFTLSAAEIFTDQFTNIENTLIIGQNTFGMLLTTSGLPLYLPNSGIPVGMGRYMLVHPEGAWQEGVGFAPDVWVVGDALKAALNLLLTSR